MCIRDRDEDDDYVPASPEDCYIYRLNSDGTLEDVDVYKRQANVLLLDEPTNHLDLLSREALEEALLDYTGTLLIVSHDRYLLSRIPTRLVELSSSGLSWYDSYQEYLDKNLETPSSEQNSDTVSDPSQGAKEYYRTKQQRALDRCV